MMWQSWHLVPQAFRDLWGTGSSSKAQLSHVCLWMLTRWSGCCLRTAWAFAKGHPAIDTVRRQKKEQNKSLFTAESSYELAHPPALNQEGTRERKANEGEREEIGSLNESIRATNKESEWQVTFQMPSFFFPLSSLFRVRIPHIRSWRDSQLSVYPHGDPQRSQARCN